MNNKVNPQAMMHFKCTKAVSGVIVGEIISIDRDDGLHVSAVNQSMHDLVIDCVSFDSSFEFVPQNELEYLAVNIKVWNQNTNLRAFKNDSIHGYGFVSTTVPGSCSHSQWQECRYEIGLDDRPQKEEVKMYFMYGKVVGDQFECHGDIVTLAYISKSRSRFVLDSNSGGVMVCNKNGNGCTSAPFQLKSHDPRPWLKDMPDAGLFSDGWLAFEHEGDGWSWYSSNPSCGDARLEPASLWFLKCLPLLTGEQWVDSCISIADLAKWQAERK